MSKNCLKVFKPGFRYTNNVVVTSLKFSFLITPAVTCPIWKALHFGRVAPAIFKCATEKEERCWCWSCSWPAISDIWLGVRTVPVLSVATESRGAGARSRTGGGAPEHRCTSRAMRTAWSTIECEETFEFCLSVCWCFLLFQNKLQAKGCLQNVQSWRAPRK